MARNTKKFWTAIVKEGSIYKIYCGYCTEKNCAAWASVCLFDRYGNLRETPGRLFSSDGITSSIKPAGWVDKYYSSNSETHINAIIDTMTNRVEYGTDSMKAFINAADWCDIFLAKYRTNKNTNILFKTSIEYRNAIMLILRQTDTISELKHTVLINNMDKARLVSIKTTRKGEPKGWCISDSISENLESWFDWQE